MWIRLTGEYINLGHIVRVRANKTFKNGHEEWAVELEGIVKGELQYFTRYRGIDAEIIVHALETHSRLEPRPIPGDGRASTGAPNQATTTTVHDVNIM